MSGSMERQARMESMRGGVQGGPGNQAHNSFVFRRHQDYSRECQRKVYNYARETRLLVSKIDRFRKEVLEKQQELEGGDSHHSRTARSLGNKHQVEITPPKLHKDKKDVLLFRVRYRAGEKVYIRDEEKFPSIPVHSKIIMEYSNKRGR